MKNSHFILHKNTTFISSLRFVCSLKFVNDVLFILEKKQQNDPDLVV